MALTDYQEVAGMALDISDEQAAKIQRAWPENERNLRSAMKQWREITGSTISGRELLIVCAEIWKQRPAADELALSQGRAILYHPVDGSPIAQGSPLDGIPLETLAFLKWSLDKGLLGWTDDVTIAREVKAARSVIDDLPGDRFYGKFSLPHLPEGGLDWSDLGLAKAKDFVQKGNLETTLPEPHYGGDDTLAGVLCSMPSLRDSMNRDRLLRGLPAGPTGCIRRSSAYGTDIALLVEAVEGFGRLANDGRSTTERWAINVLIDNAISLVEGTQVAHKLEAFKK